MEIAAYAGIALLTRYGHLISPLYFAKTIMLEMLVLYLRHVRVLNLAFLFIRLAVLILLLAVRLRLAINWKTRKIGLGACLDSILLD